MKNVTRLEDIGNGYEIDAHVGVDQITQEKMVSFVDLNMEKLLQNLAFIFSSDLTTSFPTSITTFTNIS